MTEPGAYLVAIDNGSQSTKVTIFDELGTVHASAQRRLRPYDTSGGHVVHPDDDLWQSITATCSEALAAFAGDRSRIVAVGLCTIRFCRALLDADGMLVEPVLSWMDPRVSRALEADDRVRYVTTSSGYITRRMTGELRDTAANYQGVWPIDQRTARWSDDEERYRATGMRRDQLFDLVDPGDLLGSVTAAAAAATGLPAGVPVVATANDKAVEALGGGLGGRSTDDVLLLSLGTYIAGMATGREPEGADERYWVNFGSMPGSYLFESRGIRRGMWTVSWYRDLLDGNAPAGEGESEEALNRGAEQVPPGSGGLVTLVDWLAPAEAPYRRGALLGFDGSQGRFHIYRSILEGIALTMRAATTDLAEALGRRFTSVIVSGGGSRSDLMMRIVADVFDLPAHRSRMPDAAGLGAAICAAVGVGVHPDWETAIARMTGFSETFAPQPETVAAYRDVARVYDGIRQFSDPLFRHLAD